MELNHNFFGAWDLKSAGGAIASKGDFGVGQVTAEHDVVAPAELDSLAVKGERGDGGGGIVRIVEPEHTRTPQRIIRNGIEVGQPTVCATERHEHNISVSHHRAGEVNGVPRHQRHITRVE